MRAVPKTAPLIEDTNDKSVSFHAKAVVKPRRAKVVWLRRDEVRFSSGILRRSSVPSLVPTKRRGYLMTVDERKRKMNDRRRWLIFKQMMYSRENKGNSHCKSARADKKILCRVIVQNETITICSECQKCHGGNCCVNGR